MPDQSPGWTTLLGMGATIAGQLVVGVLLGLLVDHLTGSSPVFLLVGLLLGIVAAVAYTVTQFRKYLHT